MNRDYWHRQTKDKPLFPDLHWSRPENRAHAGKLLIIGGNAFGFAAPAEAYAESLKAGAGLSRVLLPDAIKTLAGQSFEAVDFAPSTPSGSFGRKSLAELIDHALWADSVLFAGDIGRNSETAIVIESFLQKYSGQVTITKDAVDYLYSSADAVLQRSNTTLVVSIAQLQKLAKAAKFTKAVTFNMGLLLLVDFLHEFTLVFKVHLVIKHLDNICVAVGGQVSTTKLEAEYRFRRVKAAAHASVWWLQNPNLAFESITTSVVTIDYA